MNASNTALTNDANDEALDDILNNIKGVITGRSPNTDVLDLTMKIADGASVEKAAQQSMANYPQEKQAANQNDALIDNKVAQESREALKHFIRLAERNEIDSLPLKNGNTVEDIIIDLLKPQLSDWLNKNLPGIVNNIVQREIKKLIPQDE
jgi:cell pole-organizing protein PopZ